MDLKVNQVDVKGLYIVYTGIHISAYKFICK